MGIRALGLCLALMMVSYPVAAAVHIDRRDDRTHYRFQIDGIAFTKVQIENQEFLRARLSGIDGYEGVLYEVGRPELPVIRFYVEGEGELRIRKAKASQASPPLARLRLKPALAPVERTEGAKEVLFFDERVYQLDEVQPAVDFDVEAVGSSRGKPRRLVTLFPLHHNPVSGEYRWSPQFEVTFTPAAPEAKASRQSDHETIALVTDAAFINSPSLDRFIAFKRTLGFAVHTIESDDADQIRAALQERYQDLQHPLTHALLIGDSTGEPDHYFRAIDTDDYDEDVASPDIGVGRIPAKTEEELAAALDGLILYEQGLASPLPELGLWYSSHPTFHDEDEFIRAQLPLAGPTAGGLTADVLSALWRYYGGSGLSRYYWETLGTLGDPSLVVRSEDPREAVIDYARVLPAGELNPRFTVIGAEGPVAGVRVALRSLTRDFLFSTYTDVDGVATFELTPEAASGAYGVTASGQNLKLWTGELRFAEPRPMGTEIAEAGTERLRGADELSELFGTAKLAHDLKFRGCHRLHGEARAALQNHHIF